MLDLFRWKLAPDRINRIIYNAVCHGLNFCSPLLFLRLKCCTNLHKFIASCNFVPFFWRKKSKSAHKETRVSTGNFKLVEKSSSPSPSPSPSPLRLKTCSLIRRWPKVCSGQHVACLLLTATSAMLAHLGHQLMLFANFARASLCMLLESVASWPATTGPRAKGNFIVSLFRPPFCQFAAENFVFFAYYSLCSNL